LPAELWLGQLVVLLYRPLRKLGLVRGHLDLQGVQIMRSGSAAVVVEVGAAQVLNQ